MSDAQETSYAQEVRDRGDTPVSVAYSDTDTVSREAYVYQDHEGWHLVDDEACAAWILPDRWQPFVAYGWMEDDNFPQLPAWDPEKHDHWLVILPAPR